MRTNTSRFQAKVPDERVSLPLFSGSPEVKMKRVKVPLDMRLFYWMWHQIGTPRRVIRLTLWAMTWYPKVRSFMFAWLGPRVNDLEKRHRDVICEICEFRDGDYCGECGCWQWEPAKLKRKNKLKNWSCPKMRHPGEYRVWQTGCSSCGDTQMTQGKQHA